MKLKRYGLKTKIITGIFLLFGSCIALVSWLAYDYLEHYLKESITREQYNFTSNLALNIYDKLNMAQNAVIAVAAGITPEMFSDREKLQKFIDTREVCRLIFDNGMFLFSDKGLIIAESPDFNRYGKDYSYREYFQKTMELKKSYISKPYISSQTHAHPSIMITAPIFMNGSVVAVLGGSIDLTKPNFLGRIAALKLANSGYFYVFTQKRLMIVHPKKEYILTEFPEGVNPLFDKVVKENFEGADYTSNFNGDNCLACFKKIPNSDWILGASVNIDEAFQPIYYVREYYIILMCSVFLFLCLAIANWLKYLINPLLKFAAHVNRLSEKKGRDKFIKIDSGDEIGMLADEFNKMIISNQTQYEALIEKENELKNYVKRLIELNDILKASETRYKSLFENMLNGFSYNKIIYDEKNEPCDFCIIEANGYFCNTFNIIKTDFLNKKVSEIFPAYPREWKTEIFEVCRTLKEKRLDCYVPTIGKWFDIIIYLPEPGYFVTIFSDITERKNTEQIILDAEKKSKFQLENRVLERTAELRQANEKLFDEINEKERIQNALKTSENKYRTLMEQTYDLIFELEPDGKCSFASANNLNIIGYTPSELIGHYYCEFIHPDDIEPTNREFEMEINGIKTENVSFIARFKCKNSNYINLEITGKVFETETGGKRIIVVGRDITAKIKLEEEIIKSSKLESLGILAGGIAHDFNNILMGIIGNVVLAKKRIKNDDRTIEILSRIETVVYKAKSLTEQLITFSKGGMPVKKLVNINEILSENFKFSTAGTNIITDFELNDSINFIEADSGQLAQVFTNLAINSKQAMPDGGVISVKTRVVDFNEHNELALDAGKYVEIIISDNGVGISSENIAKIFDPYFTTRINGNGLGLATAYSIIKNHYGTINVASEIGRGTTFTIYLPAMIKSADCQYNSEEPADFSIVLKEKKVLVMDDDEMVLNAVKEMFEHMKIECLTAATGEAAIELYIKSMEEGRKIDYVIMDLVIKGGMGGVDAIKALKKIDPGIYAIVSSGYSHDPVMADYKKYGFRGVLAKPYKEDDLVKVLMHC
ncbi:MAG: PAS domain S-box protein [Candidatus Wallbacteria bacterium]